MSLKKKFNKFFNLSRTVVVRQWISNTRRPPLNGKKVLLTILRNGTWIEWGLYSGCVLRQMGYTPVYIYKSSTIDHMYGKRAYFWRKSQSIPNAIFVNIDNYLSNKEEVTKLATDLPNYIIDAVAYDYHIERQDVLDNLEKYKGDINNLINDSVQAKIALNDIVGSLDIYRFICYSGLINITPTLLKTALENNIETVCVEGWAWKEGHVIYNFNSPALEYNIKAWMEYYQWDSEKQKIIEEYIGFQENNNKNKEWLKGFYNVQLSDISKEFDPELREWIQKNPKSFLLAPNVIGDSSTLNRETIFASIRVWMAEIVEFFKDRPDISLIIRAHPAEIWVKDKAPIKLGKYAKEISKGIPNIFVIDAADKVNSFSLLPHIHTGLIWLSSIGVDLVVRDIPVICAASPKYGGLDIVLEPETKEKYFEEVEKRISDHSGTTQTQKLLAKQYLYTVFKGFSYPAQSPNFKYDGMVINNMPEQEKHDEFFRIVVGEVESPDRIKG